MRFETDRLILEPWRISDTADLRPIATDPEVMHYITGGVPWTEEQIRLFVERQVELYERRGFCRWKVIGKQDDELIGFCGAGFFRDVPDPEIGWWLARRYWNQGLATEAARVALHDAFDRVRLDRIISVAAPANRASTRVMEKLGLHFETEFEVDGKVLVQYAISRAEYGYNRIPGIMRVIR